MTTHRTVDRRVSRSRRRLREALGTLVHEKPYDAIAVKEILDRADVGRSTFYAHFRDKDELLAACIGDLLRKAFASADERVPAHERPVRFARPVFAHVDVFRRAGAEAMGARGRALMHGRLQTALREALAAELARDLRHRVAGDGRPPIDLVAGVVVSTFLQVLDWWVQSDSELTAPEVDAVFRALTLPTLAALYDATDGRST